MTPVQPTFGGLSVQSQLWRDVYVAAIRHGCTTAGALFAADSAVDAFNLRKTS